MNKKLISLAIAAAMAAPAAALADATMYGKIHVSIDYIDMDEFVTYPGSQGAKGLDSGVFSHAIGTLPRRTFGTSPSSPLSKGYLPGGHDSASPLAALGAWTDALAFGTELPDGTRVTDGIAGYAAASHEAYQEAIDQGLPQEVAVVRGLEAGSAEARANGSSEQLTAALAEAALAGRGTGYNGWDVTSVPGASRFGIKGSEDLGGGLKAIYQLEFGVDPAEGNFSTTLRNSFVGLAGNWGTALVGRHDTPLKISTGKLDMFADTMADYNLTVGFDDIRASNTIAYISPSWSGFQLAAATVAPGVDQGYQDIYSGFLKTNNADSLTDAYSIAAIYKNGPFYGSVAYESFSDKWFNEDNPTYQALYGKTADDYNKWRIGLGLLDWNGFTLSGVYEDQSSVLGAPDKADRKLWQIQAGYAFGSNQVKAMYGQADIDKCADPYGHGYRYTCNYGLGLVENKDKSTWALAFDHNFSKRTKAYALYTEMSDDNDNADWSGFSLDRKSVV